MKQPVGKRVDIDLVNPAVKAHFIDTGSPHAILFVSDLETCDVTGMGRLLRHHHAFAPAGANINFVKRGVSGLSVRTYERGVEAETLACGTGAVACAVIECILHKTPPPIAIHVRSGENLTVDFKLNAGEVDQVVLEGSAHLLFSGEVEYHPESMSLAKTSIPT